MNNFAIQHEGKEYWISRSMAVACFVFANINNEWRVVWRMFSLNLKNDHSIALLV